MAVKSNACHTCIHTGNTYHVSIESEKEVMYMSCVHEVQGLAGFDDKRRIDIYAQSKRAVEGVSRFLPIWSRHTRTRIM